MAQDELDAFFDAVRRDRSLAEAFAAAAADVARNNGFDVDDQDFIDRFHGDEPEPRPLPPPGGGRHTMAAMGAEGGRMTTMAVGEEGGPRPVPPVSVTLAIGEEDRRATGGIGEDTHKGKPTPITDAIGEDGPVDPPTPPKPPSDDDADDAPGFGMVTTLALGEEEKRRKPKPDHDDAPVTSMALGEEDKKKHPPAHPITTKAVGEEEKRKDPPPRRVTTMAVGEESKKRPRP